MLKIWFFHALEYLNRLGCWCGSPKDYSNHWPSLTFMGNTAPTEKQENRVWVAQGKSTILCHFGLLTALMKLIRTISSSPSSCCSSIPPPRRPQYPEMYTGSNEVWGDVTMLTITDFSLDNIMLLVFATLISPSPSIRCSFINHSLHAAIVFSRNVDSVYLVCIHNGWWFSYPVIWFGPSEGRNDKASWLWPSSRPNQILLILMDYCTWQFLVSLVVDTGSFRGGGLGPPNLFKNFQPWLLERGQKECFNEGKYWGKQTSHPIQATNASPVRNPITAPRSSTRRKVGSLYWCDGFSN